MHGLNDAGQPVTQQTALLVYIHGGLMTCWMVLFLLQCSLVAKGNRRLHMRVGRAAVVLYAVIVPVATITALLQIHYADPQSFPPFGPYRFLTLPLTEITNFTLFVGAGFLFRHTPALHRAPFCHCLFSFRYFRPAEQLCRHNHLVAAVCAHDNALREFLPCAPTFGQGSHASACSY